MDLQSKRAELVAQVEQYVGQINRNNGAIAILDELIAEEAAADALGEGDIDLVTTMGGINRATNPMWQNSPPLVEPPSAAPDWVQPPVKEMPHAQPEDVS